MTSNCTLVFAGNNRAKGGCPANLPSRGATLIGQKGMATTLIRPHTPHTHTYIKSRGLAGRLQLRSAGSMARERGTHWALNSHHLHIQGHWQRLKQLNIPPSVAPHSDLPATAALSITDIHLQINRTLCFHLRPLQLYRSHTPLSLLNTPPTPPPSKKQNNNNNRKNLATISTCGTVWEIVKFFVFGKVGDKTNFSLSLLHFKEKAGKTTLRNQSSTYDKSRETG